MSSGGMFALAAALLRRDLMASSHWSGRDRRACEPAWRGACCAACSMVGEWVRARHAERCQISLAKQVPMGLAVT